MKTYEINGKKYKVECVSADSKTQLIDSLLFAKLLGGLTMDFKYYVDYFSMLEERLYNMKRYIAFEEENLNTFSIELASIINDCCGLINRFCTKLCQEKQKK